MAKINRTPEVNKFLNFIDSNESRNTELSSRTSNCLSTEKSDEFKDAIIRMQALKDMGAESAFLD